MRRAVLTPLPNPCLPYRTKPSSPPRLWRSTSPELILQPITIHRSEIEYTTIEPAVNSARPPRPPARPHTRSLATQLPLRRRAGGALGCHGRSPLSFVRAATQCRISMKIKQIDEMDGIIADKFSRFLMQRADNFVVLRRKALPVRPPAARRLASPFRPPPPPPALPALVPGIHTVPPAFWPAPEPEPRPPRCHAGLRHLLPSDQLQPREHVQAQADRLRRTVHGRDRLGGPPSHPPSRPATRHRPPAAAARPPPAPPARCPSRLRACALPAPPATAEKSGTPRAQISAMKIQVNERARTIAFQYLKEFT